MGRNRFAVLELAVLGLLHRTPMHGYELRKQLTNVLGLFRALSYGSLYPCLHELLAAGLIAEEHDETRPTGPNGPARPACPRPPVPVRTGRARRLAPLVLLGDQPGGQQLVQARIQRPVRQRAEQAEYIGELLAQLVAVHWRPVQQPEHGELEYAGPVAPQRRPFQVAIFPSCVSRRCVAAILPAVRSSRCITSIYRDGMRYPVPSQAAGHDHIRTRLLAGSDVLWPT